ncbi:hypothetical protein BJY04DRAFT_222512 [Aspergillus karnatakaensis]|uniref:uncharacterized protein n=1 Tax=Aspergillus karnatakaensis TaxID=1810916 RepID=UPI003CCE3552
MTDAAYEWLEQPEAAECLEWVHRENMWTESTLAFFQRQIAHDASRVLLLLSDGGSDLLELRELDIPKGNLVPNGFQTNCLSRMSTTWLNGDHILINHTLYGAPTTAAGWPATTYIWKRGTDLRQATAVHTSLASDAICFVGALEPADHDRVLIVRVLDYSNIQYLLVNLDGTIERVNLPTRVPVSLSPIIAAGNIVVSLAEPATVCERQLPGGSLVAYNTSPSVQRQKGCP